MSSQINVEINTRVLQLCEQLNLTFNNIETKELYKLWINSLPKEITEDASGPCPVRGEGRGGRRMNDFVLNT